MHGLACRSMLAAMFSHAVRRKFADDGRPSCPTCEMGMIVVGGFGLEIEDKTFECLRCVAKPDTTPRAA
jgi:hypothetical protein